jgi:sulfatase maturation enzyme AslB (radical SAM superfamily)
MWGMQSGGNLANIKLHETMFGKVTMAALPGGYTIEPIHDSFGRRVNYMRISLTDACNLRCVYCMPEDHDLPPRQRI